jgi:hypothetical protein
MNNRSPEEAIVTLNSDGKSLTRVYDQKKERIEIDYTYIAEYGMFATPGARIFDVLSDCLYTARRFEARKIQIGKLTYYAVLGYYDDRCVMHPDVNQLTVIYIENDDNFDETTKSIVDVLSKLTHHDGNFIELQHDGDHWLRAFDGEWEEYLVRECIELDLEYIYTTFVKEPDVQALYTFIMYLMNNRGIELRRIQPYWYI